MSDEAEWQHARCMWWWPWLMRPLLIIQTSAALSTFSNTGGGSCQTKPFRLSRQTIQTFSNTGGGSCQTKPMSGPSTILRY